MDVKLPEIGEGVTEGELVKWLVKPGDTVNVDQAIAEVMTDKATVEVPSPVKGTVTALKAKEGDTIQVGGVLLTLEAGAGASTAKEEKKAPTPASQPAKPATPGARPSTPAASPAHTAAAATTSNNGGNRPNYAGASASPSEIYPPVAASKVLATPSTRRLAREMDIDLNVLKGSGLAGRVTREDVMQAAGGGLETYSTPTRAPALPYVSPGGAVEERVPLRGIRKKVAEKMQLSKQIIPHFTLMDEANVTELVNMRSAIKDKMAKQGVKITYLPFVMKALIATAREFTALNATIDDQAQEIVYKKYFNIGFAADTPNGLVVPVIKDADRKSILHISQEIVELSEKARANKLSPDDMKGATISITNIGSVGGTYATPIINHPEVAILGMYKIQERPIFKDGELASAHIMNLTITADHRLIDGAVAARFLVALIQRLENPGLLMMDLA